MLQINGRKFMIGSVFTRQRLSKDFIFCQFIKTWAPIFAHPNAVTNLKNALYYPHDGEVEKAGKVGGWSSWEVEKGRRVLRWECEKFLVLFKGGECRVSPKFHLFVFDVNQGNKKTGWNCHWNCMYLFGGLQLGS